MPEARKVIAVCATWEDEQNLNLFLSYLIQETEQRDFLPVCITFDRDLISCRGEKSMREFMALLQINNLAGVILFGEMIRSDDITQGIIRLAQKKGLPVFMLERHYEGCINLQMTFREGFEAAVRHVVVDHGCTDVVMVAGKRNNIFSDERIEVCRNVLKAVGSNLSDDRILYGDFWDVPTFRAVSAYFRGGGKMPKAFICANDAMAIAVCDYLSEHGQHVPDEVIVTGFDGVISSEKHDPAITTWMPNYPGMIRMILDTADSWSQSRVGQTEVVPVSFIPMIRESCGCQHQSHLHASKTIGSLTRDNLDYSRHIREMGQFVRKTLNMDSMEKFVSCLPEVFSIWPDPYYSILLLDEKERGTAETLLHGENGRYTSGDRFQWNQAPLPDMDEVLRRRDIRIALARLLQNDTETMGYMICGMKAFNLRDEQRFEEQAVFMSSTLSAVLQNRRLGEAYEEIQMMAERDYLTGLYNRRGFFDRLGAMLQLPEMREKFFSLFSVDLDGLKKINDSYGHAEGDAAIQYIAKALEMETDSRGICARYGGDEFAFALFTDEPVQDIEMIRSEIEGYAESLCAGKPYHVTASIGMSTMTASECHSLDDMLVQSDAELYKDKKQRKSMRDD